ncbi:MAG TPA: cation diffusion facilitator family transporter [Paracoccaceae bacterium]|nr:cation diffusion facilitator family transporter [Paracoccaceae bacterium]
MARHGHHHHHHDHGAGLGSRRLLWAVLVNLGLTVAQIVGGLLAGSLALIADAVHNLSDAVSLVIAWGAARIALRPADARMTFGYRRAEVLAAFVNYLLLIVIGLYLAWEAVLRFLDPPSVDGWLVVVVAGVAFAVDLATAALTFAQSRHSMNIRAAFLHNVADALGSVAVIVAGTLILLYDWRLADPAVTLVIAGYMLWHGVAEIGGSIRILLLGTPPDVAFLEVQERLAEVEGVREVHHLHLWQLDEHRVSVEAHLVVEPEHWEQSDAIAAAARRVLREAFGIAHATLETERPNSCAEEGNTVAAC